MLEAVIFDFDGIIVDSEPLHFQAFTEVLKPLGADFSWEDYCDIYIGYDDRDAFRVALTDHDLEASKPTIKDLIMKKAIVFQEMIEKGLAHPLPGAVELIKNLANVLPIGLCSGALSSDIHPILNNLDLSNAFKTIVSAEDTAQSKPQPDPYLLAIKKLNLTDPKYSIAIEDTPAGIISAKTSGLRVVAITNSYDKYSLQEADYIADSLCNIDIKCLQDIVM